MAKVKTKITPVSDAQAEQMARDLHYTYGRVPTKILELYDISVRKLFEKVVLDKGADTQCEWNCGLPADDGDYCVNCGEMFDMGVQHRELGEL